MNVEVNMTVVFNLLPDSYLTLTFPLFLSHVLVQGAYYAVTQ